MSLTHGFLRHQMAPKEDGMMLVACRLPFELRRKLINKATDAGAKSLSSYLRGLIEDHLKEETSQ